MAKVCISIRDIDSIYCKFMAETRRDEVLEIRLDKCGFSEQEIKDVFPPRERQLCWLPILAVLRRKGKMPSMPSLQPFLPVQTS